MFEYVQAVVQRSVVDNAVLNTECIVIAVVLYIYIYKDDQMIKCYKRVWELLFMLQYNMKTKN